MEFTEVYTVTENYARLRLRGNDELISTALVLAWWLWTTRKEDYCPSHWAQLAVRRTLDGRDLPGVKDGKFRDIWDNLTHWQGSGMGQVQDRSPGPDQQVMETEEYERIRGLANRREGEMMDTIADDWGQGTMALAASLGVSPGLVSQMRRRLADKAKE